MWGSVEACAALFNELVKLENDKVHGTDLPLKIKKCAAIIPGEEDMRRAKELFDKRMVKKKRLFLKCNVLYLGTPIGDDVFVKKCLTKKLVELN